MTQINLSRRREQPLPVVCAWQSAMVIGTRYGFPEASRRIANCEISMTLPAQLVA